MPKINESELKKEIKSGDFKNAYLFYGEESYWEKAERYASDVIDGKCGFYKLEPTIAL